MAIGSSTILASLAAASAVSSFAGGVSASREAKKQAATAEAEANMRAEETARAGVREANALGVEAESTRRRQKMAYLKSGVDLSGSPLMVMEATRRSGLDNVEETLRASSYGAAAQIQEGRSTARALKSSGRQALIAGIGNAAGSAATGYSAYKAK